MNWIDIEKDGLPKESGNYLVNVKDGFSHDYENIDILDDLKDLSYVTCAYFDISYCLWTEDENSQYNGCLSVIDKTHSYYISHWAPLPKGPEE